MTRAADVDTDAPVEQVASVRDRDAQASVTGRVGRYCIDVLTQISAAQAALEKVALGLFVAGQLQADRTDELMATIGRLVKRGLSACENSVSNLSVARAVAATLT